MTTSKTEKFIIIALLMFLLPAAAGARGVKQTRGPEIQITAGIIPVYHFSVKPEGMNYKEYYYTGSNIQGLISYRKGRVSVRTGLAWNLLFRVESKETEIINMISPTLAIYVHFKKYFYTGIGLAGVIVPGDTKIETNTYDTKFDLWYTLLAGYRLPLSSGFSLLVELNYNLNVTHRQWSSGVDNTQTGFQAETKLSHMLTVYSGVSFPLNW